MALKRQQTGKASLIPDPPDTGEVTMIASGTRQPELTDRWLRNRIILLNFVAWIVILSLIWWIVA